MALIPLLKQVVTLHILSSFNAVIRRFPIQFNLIVNMSEDSYRDEYSDEERGGSQDPAPFTGCRYR